MIKEIRTVTARGLRELCIKNGWFTCGDDEDYEKLMEYSEKENIKTEDLEEMAEIIIEFSDEENMEYCGYQKEDVMFSINLVCVTRFERK